MDGAERGCRVCAPLASRRIFFTPSPDAPARLLVPACPSSSHACPLSGLVVGPLLAARAVAGVLLRPALVGLVVATGIRKLGSWRCGEITRHAMHTRRNNLNQQSSQVCDSHDQLPPRLPVP